MSEHQADRSLKAIVGLGNPGSEYAQTRHNAGFWFVDAMAAAHRSSFRVESKFFGSTARVRIGNSDVLLLKPSTFMNRSGQSVQALAGFYKLEPADILIAHDELDLPAGTARLKISGGHGGHNGLRNIHQHLGEHYRRLRIGVGHPGQKELVMHWLTEQRISKVDELRVMQSIDHAQAAVSIWLEQSWDKAVQRLNTKTDIE
jgi:PTH1 family peptidyl-tRNA hydrolase